MNTSKFMIGGWLAPNNTKKDYLLARECGLNTMYLLGAPGWLGDDEQVEAVRICKEVGMDAIPVVWNQNLVVADERLTAFDNVPAIILYDEPSMSKFPVLVEKIDEFYKNWDKNVRCEINLYPSYTPPKALGTENYFEYVQTYVEQVHSKMQGANVFSLDFYALFKREGKIVVTEMWLPCLSIFSHFAVKENLPLHCFIQTMPFAIGNDVDQTFETLRLQFMVYMAFGFRAFSHFCYASPGISEEFREHQQAVVGRDGEPTPLYKEVQKVNAFVQTFAESYLPYTYKGTTAFSPTQVKMEDFCGWAEQPQADTSLFALETDCPVLVGNFEKGTQKAFFLTHYALPNEKDGTITLRFAKPYALTVRKDGVCEEVETDCFTIHLEAGNGVFIEVKESV